MRISSSIQSKVLLLSALTIGPVIALLGYFNWDQLQKSREIEKIHLINVTKLVASQYEQIHEGARQLLISLSVSPQINTRQCRQYLSSLLSKYSRYANIAIANPNGDVSCSAVELSEPINLSDRYFFKNTQTYNEFTVGEYVISRVTGIPSLNFGYPLPNDQGVVYVSLDLSWLGEIVANLKLDPNSVVKVFDQNGTVLARYPDSEKWTGVNSVDIAEVEKFISSEATQIGTGVDNVERLYAYQRIGQAAEGPYVSIGIPENTLYEHSRNDFINNLELSILVASSSLAVGWIIGGSLITKMIAASRQVDELKKDFVSLVTHQIRTPLTAIKWFTQMLQSGSPGQLSLKQKKILRDTAQSVNRMTNLVSILLTISKLESGKIPLNLRPHSIAKAIEEVAAELKKVYYYKKVKFLLEIGRNVPDLIAFDAQLMQQALVNLISNAYKYSDDGAQVKVTVKYASMGLLVEIHNTGVGINKADYERLWAKFARGSNAHTKDTEGAGLGLYLTKLIINAHGGRIWFTDSRKKGTSFLFTIPVKVV